MPPITRGIPFDDLDEGQEWWTMARTVTNTDNILCLALAGDYNPLHSDREFAGQHRFGQKVPPGYLSILFVFGFIDRLGILEGVGRAILNLDWDWQAPVWMNDTIHARIYVDELKEVSDPEEGIVTYGIEVYNQDEELVQEGSGTFLIDR